MSFSAVNGINIYKPLLNNNSLSGIIRITASGDTAAGTITTTSGNISSTSGNIQTRDGTVGGKNGTFQNLIVSGVKYVPESRGIYMGLDSDAAGGIDICADTNHYIDFTTLLYNYKGRLIYNATNNEFKMKVNGNASASLIFNDSI